MDDVGRMDHNTNTLRILKEHHLAIHFHIDTIYEHQQRSYLMIDPAGVMSMYICVCTSYDLVPKMTLYL